MWHTNSQVKVKFCKSLSRAFPAIHFQGLKGKSVLQDSQVPVVREEFAMHLFHVMSRKGSYSGQHIGNQIAHALALDDFSIFCSFPEFFRSMVQGVKQKCLSYTRVTLLSDTQDTRGYLLLGCFQRGWCCQRDDCTNSSLSVQFLIASLYNKDIQINCNSLRTKSSDPKDSCFKPHKQEGRSKDLKVTLKLSAFHE